MRKKILLGVCVILFVGAIGWYGLQKPKETNKEELKIGVSLYIKDDAFVNSIVSAMKTQAVIYEQRTNKKVALNVSCADGSQREQNKQIEKFISLQYDVICVNLVDRTNAAPLIDQVHEANIPLIFFNREPVKEDIFRQEDVYYMGTDAKETGIQQGQAVIDLYEQYPEQMDKNQDGVLQYVVLEGEMGHQDTALRCEYVLQTLQQAGIPLEKLDADTADWLYSPAEAITEEWAKEFGDEIELVLSNNDEMALGAASALQEQGISAAIFGIDATPAGKKAVRNGELWATVDCDAEQQGKTLVDMVTALATDKITEKEGIKESRYVRVPVTTYVSENIK